VLADMNDRTASRQIGLNPHVAFKQAVGFENQGNLREAEKIYRAILKQHPDNSNTLHNLASVLLRADRPEEATQVLRKVLNHEPRSAEIHVMLANALRKLERYDEALERTRRAITLDPGLAEAHATLAQCLSELGRYDEAVPAQARAIELAPNQPLHYYHWGQVTRWTAADPRLATLEALAEKSGSLPLDAQIHLNFALAKAYADCGDIDRAFRHQIEGGALKRQVVRYHEAITLRQLDELCQEIDAEWLRGHQGIGDPSPLPVFIVGMPRSGTTLVEQILASHPKVRALGERSIFSEGLARICATSGVPTSIARKAAQWSDSQLRKLGSLYLEAARRGVPSAVERISDKANANFQYVGLIHAALPNARIIHTRRDAVDTCLSIFSMLFLGDHQPYSYDLGELGRAYRAYDKMMAHWRNVVPGGVMLEVQYEEVVDDLERQARRIIAHCGLEWDNACLEFHKTDRPVRTASHTQVRQPIYRSSVGRPRPPRDLLLPLLQALGQATERPDPRPDSATACRDCPDSQVEPI
jgi:tetratricopeptide (TPR) repeat protein